MEPKQTDDPSSQDASSVPRSVDEWGLPAATTHLDEPAEPELGYCADDDPEDTWD